MAVDLSDTKLSDPKSSEAAEKDNTMPEKQTQVPPNNGVDTKHHYGWRFYAVYSGLIAATLVSALDGSIVATALPTIAATLDSGPNYVWIANVYFLTGAIVQPLFAQLSDLWGRRWVFIMTVVIFTVGSGLCGGSTSSDMLIASRAIQGVGAGGINMMVDLIICDLVPMRDRGKYLGMVFGVIGIFTAVGPLIGGVLAQHGAWRWAFYLNIPICGLTIINSVLFLQVGNPIGGSFFKKMASVDWGGIIILTLSTVGVMYAITYGGSLRDWSDASVLGPLVAGLCLLIVFVIFEGSSLAREPVTPYRLFANRTSACAFALTFLHSVLCQWTMYIFSLYFQAVLLESPTMAGVNLMPTVIGFPLAAAIGGGIMTKYGKYKPIHLGGFALLTLGCGLSSILGPHSHTAAWLFFQLFIALGMGIIMACLLPAVQAELSEADTALSTGTWAFIRSYGVIWGVTIPAAVFNNRFNDLLYTIPAQNARDTLANGQAYAHATADLVKSFGGETTEQVRNVYSLSIERVWQVSVIFAGLSFLVSLLENQVTLRTSLETEFGLEQEGEKNESATGSDAA